MLAEAYNFLVFSYIHKYSLKKNGSQGLPGFMRFCANCDKQHFWSAKFCPKNSYPPNTPLNAGKITSKTTLDYSKVFLAIASYKNVIFSLEPQKNISRKKPF